MCDSFMVLNAKFPGKVDLYEQNVTFIKIILPVNLLLINSNLITFDAGT